ncbi:calcium/calmodulin-dependent protein kinase type 1B [Colletotrichum higginsianum]|uniref:Autophagy-related protein 1 n=1 Tax=Colletotrichum higginsianum (strain IMI 349063) TaxID=759273 RepID=H1V2M3_COLHI|nr:calcium/calmodulin-dependent protein kinase type 1B [Colletotrichum higginsianum]
MEYVPNGDLQKYLANPIPEDEAKVIACQLAEGLRHMHHNGFTHRDLKPGNILVVLEGPQWLVQISDFGISKRLRPDMAQQTLGTMRRGTMGFIAPEMLGFVLERDYPHAVDIWSLGAVVFRMLTKEVFLPDLTQLQKYAAKEHPFPDHRLEALKVTMSLRELLRRLLAPSPKDRPSASEILEDAWLKDISSIKG